MGLGAALLAALAGSGCQPGQELAPNCFSTNEIGACVEPVSGLKLTFDCSELPRAVAAANYEYIIRHMPLPPGHRSRWEASGLPPGLTVDHGGVLRGRPEAAGNYPDISITLHDLTTQRKVTQSCNALEVFKALSVDLSKTKYGCVSPTDNLQKLASGGTGEPLYCEVPSLENAGTGCPHGFGNGAMPLGLQVDKDCSISGNIDPSVKEDGTFVWIVEVKQSGAQRFVPFCATNEKSQSHIIERVQTGKVLDLDTPLLVTYEPTGSIRVGTNEDPRIRVTAGCENKSCNRRGVSVAGTCSPLDFSVTQMLSSVGEITNPARQVIGLIHGYDLHSGGQTMDTLGFDQRPWVMSLNTRYCTSAQVGEQRACDVPGALESNITWSVIARPRPKVGE